MEPPDEVEREEGTRGMARRLVGAGLRRYRTSIAIQSLVKITAGIAAVVLIVAVVVYLRMSSALHGQAISQLEKYVLERAQRESAIFALAEDNHAVLKGMLLEKLAQAGTQDPRDEFDRLFVRWEDGVTRNRPEIYDGTRVPGVYIDEQLTIDADIRRRVLAYYELLQTYGPAWHNRFQDLYITTPENIMVIYWPEVPGWVQQAGPGLSMPDEEYVWVADEAHDPERETVWTGLFYDSVAKVWMVSCETPVDWDGRHIATIGHDITLNEVLERAVYDHLEGAYNIIFRRDGRLIAHPEWMEEIQKEAGYFDIDKSGDERLRGIFRLVQDMDPSTVVIEDRDRDEYLAVAKIDGPGWYFVTVYPKALFSGFAFRAVTIILWGGGALLIEILLLFLVLRRTVGAPLEELVGATEQVAAGNLDVRLDASRVDELGRLAGSFNAMIGAIADRNAELHREIATRRRAEGALRESQRALRTLLGNLPGMAYRCRNDPSWTMEFVSEGSVELTGYSPSELVGNRVVSYAELEHEEDRRYVWETVQAALEEKRRFQMKYRITTAAGEEKWVWEQGVGVFAPSGDLVALEGFITDVTEQTRLERQLRQTQKLEALGTLAGGIAHDFNNILTPILDYTQLAVDDLPPESEMREDLERVLSAAIRAKDLIAQILTFARQGEQEPQPVRVGPIMKETLKLLRASLPKTIEIRQGIETEQDVVLGDPTQIHQILLNLCTNAGQAMGEGPGVLEVSLSEAEVDAEFAARHPGLKPGPHLRLAVSDTGGGIPPDVVERIFEPFFTTKGTGGTGMGLAVVHGIVRSHGGAVGVYSEPGRGTTFHVFLPRLRQPAAVEPPREEPIPRGKERILFVDDEEAIAGLGQRVLEELGYRVVATTSSVDALERFRTAPKDYDLLVTDLSMPKMSGVTLVRRVLRIRPDLPTVLCSGFAGAVPTERARAAGVGEVVLKPFTARTLGTAARRALDRASQRA